MPQERSMGHKEQKKGMGKNPQLLLLYAILYIAHLVSFSNPFFSEKMSKFQVPLFATFSITGSPLLRLKNKAIHIPFKISYFSTRETKRTLPLLESIFKSK